MRYELLLDHRARPPLLRYGAALLAVALALLLKLLVDPVLGRATPFLLFFIAVMASAWYGGVGPGLLATLFAALAVDYFFLPPIRSFASSSLAVYVQVGIFLLEGALVTLLHGALQAARQHAQASTRATRESEARNEAILATALDAVITMDHEGRVVEFNPAAEQIFGYGRAEALGREMEQLIIPPPLREAHRRGLAHYLATGEGPLLGRRYEISGVRADGTEFPVEVTITRIPSGGPPLFTGFVRDITERKRAERENARLLDEVQEGARRQRAFLREMLSSLTEGRLRLCDAPADLPEPLPPAGVPVPLSKPTLRALRKQVEAVAEGLRLPAERSQDLVTAVGEASMNAVVHGGGGEARVHADPSAGRVQVWVRDQGAGIAPDALHRATLERGYTTAGSLGHGFWMMLKTADRVWLLTGPSGTTLVLEQGREAPEPGWLNDYDAFAEQTYHRA